jgi:hypothetical protein
MMNIPTMIYIARSTVTVEIIWMAVSRVLLRSTAFWTLSLRTRADLGFYRSKKKRKKGIMFLEKCAGFGIGEICGLFALAAHRPAEKAPDQPQDCRKIISISCYSSE